MIAQAPFFSISEAKIGLFTYKTSEGGDHAVTVDVSGFTPPMPSDVPEAKWFNGRDPEVQRWMMEHHPLDHLADHLHMACHDAIITTNLHWFPIAFHDTDGRLVAPAIAEIIGRYLLAKGFRVSCAHRSLIGG